VACGELLPRGTESRAFCDACYAKFCVEAERGCSVCGAPFAECRCRPQDFLPDELVYTLPYDRREGVCRKLILSCKNRRNRAAVEEIAKLTVEAARKRGLLSSPDLLLTYVPRSPEKEIHTGVDQAKELAKAIAAQTGLPSVRLLGHRFLGKEQKAKALRERGRGTEGAYYLLAGGEMVAGRTILLVDDVVTSGATVNACAACLRKAGAERVLCLAAARSVPSRFRGRSLGADR
jgi:predicted amidophosphoribosyltransferase